MATLTDSETTADERAQALSSQFTQALVRQDFVALAACFSAETRFRALVPRGFREASGAEEAAHYFQLWFGSADRVDLLDSSIEPVVDRYHLAWRARVHDAAGQRVVEQQAYTTLRDERFADFALLCSGFRIESPAERPSAMLEGGDASCATLTPMIATRVRSLDPGQILEVITTEPTAAADLTSWTKLTGNELLGRRDVGSEQHYYIRKK